MEDRCVCCGAAIPEGRQVCEACRESGRGQMTQEPPRVLTEKEVKALAPDSEMIQEGKYSKGEVTVWIVTKQNAKSVICADEELPDLFNGVRFPYDEYGVFWRCWSRTPTKTFALHTPWEKNEA